jgi:acetylornithine deacetylase/succinyl-diaminopimelate desuccinylase-like protein
MSGDPSNGRSFPDVGRYAVAHRDRFVAELSRLLAVPSGGFEPAALAEAAALLAAMVRGLGFSVEVIPGYGPPVILARRGGDGPGGVLFYGHYDVQPAGNAAEWTSPPFAPVVREGRIYARGSGDNKGQLFAHLKAVEALDALGCPLPAPVCLLLEGEEEVGSPHLESFVREHRTRLACDLVVIADGQNFFSPTPLIGLGVRGLLCVRLTLPGPRRVLHSGNYGGIVANPALALIHLVASLRGEGGAIHLPGFYDDVVAGSAAVWGDDGCPLDLRALVGDVGGTVLAADVPDLARRLAFEPVLNVSSFHAGEGGRTNIPSSAAATIDFRLVYNQDPDAVLGALQRRLRSQEPALRIEPLRSLRPSRSAADHPAVRALIGGVTAAGGRTPLVVQSLGCSGPDSVFRQHLGAPVVRLPYADRHTRSHSVDESFSLQTLTDGVVTSAAILTAGAVGP